MPKRIRKLPAALLLCAIATGWVHATSSASNDVVFTEERLFHKEKPEPLSVWTHATIDDSRKAIDVKASDGITLRGWSFEGDPKAPVVLTFRGNDETTADPFSQARDAFFYTRLNSSVVTFDYRGTGFSEGAISLKKVLSDSLLIYDDTVKHAGGRPVFVCGWSLGLIFASYVPGHRSSVAGLILLAPIASNTTYVNDMRKTPTSALSIRPGLI
jgi:alpha-beta hydrolase superfamily lysophospholipase